MAVSKISTRNANKWTTINKTGAHFFSLVCSERKGNTWYVCSSAFWFCCFNSKVIYSCKTKRKEKKQRKLWNFIFIIFVHICNDYGMTTVTSSNLNTKFGRQRIFSIFIAFHFGLCKFSFKYSPTLNHVCAWILWNLSSLQKGSNARGYWSSVLKDVVKSRLSASQVSTFWRIRILCT